MSWTITVDLVTGASAVLGASGIMWLAYKNEGTIKEHTDKLKEHEVALLDVVAFKARTEAVIENIDKKLDYISERLDKGLFAREDAREEKKADGDN